MTARPAERSLGALWREAGTRIDRLDARLLLEHVAGCTHAALIAHPERELADTQCAQFEALVTGASAASRTPTWSAAARSTGSTLPFRRPC